MTISPFHRSILSVFPGQVLRVVLLDTLSGSLRCFIILRQDRDMTVIGHGNLDDYQYVVDPRTDVVVFDHRIVILVIPTQQYRFHPFQTDMERVYPADRIVR